MSLSEFKQGTVIHSAGESLSNLSIIIKGDAEISFHGKPLHYGQGDLLGIYDLNTGIYSHTYTAVSDVTLVSYPYDGFHVLEALLRDKAEASIQIVNSICRQISAVLQYRDSLKREAGNAYDTAKEVYPQYERLCALYALTPKRLPGLPELAPFSEPGPIESWMRGYYVEINNMDSAVRKSFFYGNSGISSGFIHRSITDILKLSKACEACLEYLTKISSFFLNGSGHDLLALVSELHINSISIKGADAAAEALMAQMSFVPSMPGIDAALYKNRMESYRNALNAERSSETITEVPESADFKRNLSDSLDIILSYSGCAEETCNRFSQYVHRYTKLSDRGSSDDDARSLRKELTAIFYEIYQHVFNNSLKDPAPPTIIKMFLNFGYVDAALAGHENADYLYSIADTLEGDPAAGVYTISEWLTAIYEGRKEPSRNEFDMDYTEYVKDMKVKGTIDEKEEKRLLANLEEKLRFELENLFPLVNKLTFGSISTFCPLFASHNVLRKLETSLITPVLLKEKLDEIRAVDFSAYSREVLYSNEKCGISNEHLHVEVLPDIVCMPNVGTRGTLWQDIEGRNRRTPSRMFLPLFLEADLKTLIINLTGEFRWEICKRVQGIRWNDVTTPSLTSLYCDYVQFYRNNRELSSDAKDAVKIEYDRAKRNNKRMFVHNYTDWLLYESNGAPRLNKVVLQMMVEYCPFSAEIREKLIKHPRYSELLTRYNLKQQQRLHRLSNVIQQANRLAKETPQELLDEAEFAKS